MSENHLLWRINNLKEELQSTIDNTERMKQERYQEHTQRLSHAIFESDIHKSFDSVVIQEKGGNFNYDAVVLIYQDIPIHLQFHSTTNDSRAWSNLKAGSENICQFEITIPTDRTDMHYELQFMQKNTKELIRNMITVCEKVEAFKKFKGKMWNDDIPRNYTGAERVPKLLNKLTEDKVFLTEHHYQNLYNILQDVLKQKQDYDVEESTKRNECIDIVQAEVQRYAKEIEIYHKHLRELCDALGKKYFKPWYHFVTTYMPSDFNPADIKDEDGNIIEDLADAITGQTSYIGKPDEEGFLTAIDGYGRTFKRKISPNIYHTEIIEHNHYPTNLSEAQFWQRIKTDSTIDDFIFYVPPGTEVEKFEVPPKPKHFVDACKEQGINDPWNYVNMEKSK
jgi:hypothetical protein